LPPHVRRFIVTSVPSVPYLEAVLLLRSERDSRWTASRMARRLYVPESEACALLHEAVTAGLAVTEGEATNLCYMFKPASLELDELVREVASHYASDIVTVTELIHSKFDKRAKQFADAFRWRKEP
jgi:hypothetical protein